MDFKNYSNKLSEGIKVESEHKDLYNYFKKFLEDNNLKMPLSEKEFFSKIAQIHIKENPEYYPLLKKYVDKDWLINRIEKYVYEALLYKFVNEISDSISNSSVWLY